MSKSEIWRIDGYDEFSNESYSIDGKYSSQVEAEAAAQKRLEDLENTQPTSSSGGQGAFGIQDRVFILRPNGTKYRYHGSPLAHLSSP